MMRDTFGEGSHTTRYQQQSHERTSCAQPIVMTILAHDHYEYIRNHSKTFYSTSYSTRMSKTHTACANYVSYSDWAGLAHQ
eukprot:2741371-Amphidinium_carterae.1